MEPLRLFLSYGHEANDELMYRIHHDLEARGHQVWIDKEKNHTGRHWRRAIYDGISESYDHLGSFTDTISNVHPVLSYLVVRDDPQGSMSFRERILVENGTQ